MPLPLLGTNTTFDTLMAEQQTIAQFGEDRAFDGVASLLNTYNAQNDEWLGAFTERTTDRLRRYGGATQMRMQRVDEMGSSKPQKIKAGSMVGFPLEMYEVSLQWTRTYMMNSPVREFAAQIDAAVTADYANLIYNIQLALFMGVNYPFTDYLVDHVDNQFALPVKALINADGAAIPPGPQGELFNPLTHTHYLASAGLTDSWAAALVETVIEHSPTGTAIIWISRADEASWTSLSEFKALTYESTIKANNQEYGVGVLDPNSLNNRMIGYFRGAHVWVKPYVPQYYTLVFMSGNGRPALAFRVRGENPNGGKEVPGAGELTLVYEDEDHPLRARAWQREFGFGAYYRTSAAVGYFNGAVYTQPAVANLYFGTGTSA